MTAWKDHSLAGAEGRRAILPALWRRRRDPGHFVTRRPSPTTRPYDAPIAAE